MRRLKLTGGICVGIALLGAVGCGQKGPLYLPERNAAVVTRPGAQPQGAAPQGTSQQPATNAPGPNAPGAPNAPGPKKKSSDQDDGNPK
jgi:predicted small lipoprotein YifL